MNIVSILEIHEHIPRFQVQAEGLTSDGLTVWHLAWRVETRRRNGTKAEGEHPECLRRPIRGYE